jgi:hypothetical protein
MEAGTRGTHSPERNDLSSSFGLVEDHVGHIVEIARPVRSSDKLWSRSENIQTIVRLARVVPLATRPRVQGQPSDGSPRATASQAPVEDPVVLIVRRALTEVLFLGIVGVPEVGWAICIEERLMPPMWSMSGCVSTKRNTDSISKPVRYSVGLTGVAFWLKFPRAATFLASTIGDAQLTSMTLTRPDAW